MGFKDQDLAAPGWWWDDEGSHNLTQGQKIYQDILLSSQYIYKSYRFLRIVEATVYHHPPQGRDQYYINYIQEKANRSGFEIFSRGQEASVLKTESHVFVLEFYFYLYLLV
uniref:Uncharacterized protein n=1 Tax=Cacopsylla melanoneura TaxID=428564 RepID=A0A8D9AD81_9HEMI